MTLSATRRGTISGVRLAASLMILSIVGCWYPEVSPRAYEITKALYSACNLQKTEKLAVIEELIEQSLDEESLTSREAAWLLDIVADARAGEWEQAALESRRILEDQIGR